MWKIGWNRIIILYLKKLAGSHLAVIFIIIIIINPKVFEIKISINKFL